MVVVVVGGNRGERRAQFIILLLLTGVNPFSHTTDLSPASPPPRVINCFLMRPTPRKKKKFQKVLIGLYFFISPILSSFYFFIFDFERVDFPSFNFNLLSELIISLFRWYNWISLYYPVSRELNIVLEEKRRKRVENK